MAISEAYRRGYKRAVADAAAVADHRMVVCADAVRQYEKRPEDARMAASERCAQREAEYIWENILKLKPAQDREETVR